MMGQLIDDLIAFSKIGKRESALQEIDMKKMVIDCYNELQLHMPVNNCRLDVQKLPSCTTDGNLVKQVWFNLISNAVKYSSKSSEPLVEVGFKKELNKTIYYIRDNGVGFDMKYADKLFGVFQRLHSQEDFEGTGIGLALVKRIIKKQGGDIWAEGEVNKGATFYFFLEANESIKPDAQ
jgi:light-regulated signal transduction histidine kinase (bacteriophytochrome)